MAFIRYWDANDPPMVLALVLITWSLTPLNSGVLDTSVSTIPIITVVASTRPSSTDIPSFTCGTNRQNHNWLFPDDPVEPLAEREDSSNLKAALADFSAPPLPFFVRNGQGFGVGVIRPHDGFLPLIQTVLLRC